MQRPELEEGLLTVDYQEQKEALSTLETSIDLLEIPEDVDTAPSWLSALNHDALLDYFHRDDEIKIDTPEPTLRILFLNAELKPAGDTYQVMVHPSTLEWLQTRFELPLLFLDCAINAQKWAKTGDACFVSHDENGITTRLDALYRMAAGAGATVTHVWSSHRLAPKTVTYIIANCFLEAKARIVQCAQGSRSRELCRPLVVDTIIANTCIMEHKAEISEARRLLLRYEFQGASHLPSQHFAETFERLHRLSQRWHILHENMIDFEERVNFLLKLSQRLPASSTGSLVLATADSLAFLASKIQIWRRWVANYNTRTNIRIHLFFNLANQTDNRTNLDISTMTKDIAEKTSKDSSSMITIAALTMLFLPGTFVSAVFGMGFFTAGTNERGEPEMIVTPQWWYFVAISIPLTIVVFAAWVIWQRRGGRSILRTGAQSANRTSLKTRSRTMSSTR